MPQISKSHTIKGNWVDLVDWVDLQFTKINLINPINNYVTQGTPDGAAEADSPRRPRQQER
jgi:hypothetical protein